MRIGNEHWTTWVMPSGQPTLGVQCASMSVEASILKRKIIKSE